MFLRMQILVVSEPKGTIELSFDSIIESTDTNKLATVQRNQRTMTPPNAQSTQSQSKPC